MSEETSDLQAQVRALQDQVGELERKLSALQDQIAAPQTQNVSGGIDEDEDDISFPVGGAGP